MKNNHLIGRNGIFNEKQHKVYVLPEGQKFEPRMIYTSIEHKSLSGLTEAQQKTIQEHLRKYDLLYFHKVNQHDLVYYDVIELSQHEQTSAKKAVASL